jgi:NAD(P)-dependent dehydrogenase (short-subunit alcohol dehydrogenase family)
MEKLFANKVTIVTGGSFGIGRATALAFAKRGAKVVIADWMQDQETLHQIKEEGGAAIFVKCDVSNGNDVRNLIAQTLQTFDGLDYAVNNAGIEGENAEAHECSEENWDKTIGINLRGVWLCMKHEIPQMIRQGKGAIVNVASIAGLIGFPGLPAYVASKHAVIGLTKTAALENAKRNIRINAVCPGVIKTAMIDRLTGKDKIAEKQFEDMEPIGRMGTPEEVAEAIVWLCSESSSFVTGHALTVDGGWLAK